MSSPPRFFLDVRRSATGLAWEHRLSERQEAIALAMAQSHGVSDIVGIDSDNVTSSGADEMWSSDLVEGIATVGEQLIPLLALGNFTGSRLPALPQAA